ncbi:MAG: glycosyltransferase, partial [Clostridia bacterium]|nr:glycosyltransferase [Clostridia bacterium]
MDFSVLMSIYYKENPDFLRQCLDSIVGQTVFPTEIVIVKDGPLTDELDEVLREYSAKNEGLYKFVPLETNHGLGYALAEGVKNCSNELIARMDTDDIARSDRFEIQLKE